MIQVSLFEYKSLQYLVDFINEKFCSWCSSPKYILDFYKSSAFIYIPFVIYGEECLKNTVCLSNIGGNQFVIHSIEGSLFGCIERDEDLDNINQLLKWLKNKEVFVK